MLGFHVCTRVESTYWRKNATFLPFLAPLSICAFEQLLKEEEINHRNEQKHKTAEAQRGRARVNRRSKRSEKWVEIDFQLIARHLQPQHANANTIGSKQAVMECNVSTTDASCSYGLIVLNATGDMHEIKEAIIESCGMRSTCLRIWRPKSLGRGASAYTIQFNETLISYAVAVHDIRAATPFPVLAINLKTNFENGIDCVAFHRGFTCIAFAHKWSVAHTHSSYCHYHLTWNLILLCCN